MSKKFTALIAEDDQVSFELYKIRLEPFHLKIIHAKNGKLAVKQAAENPEIDLILMDIRMPVMDGYQATQEIRKFNKDIPIVAQTAFAAIPEHQQMLKMGFNEFLEKPLDDSILSKILNKYIFNN